MAHGQVIDAQLEIPGAGNFKRPETQLMVTDPLQMLNKALDSGKDAETLSRFMALYKEWKADLAKEAFEDAMAKFKGETIVLLRDKTNKQYASKYISLGNLVNTVTPFLSRHGLSVNWDQEQTAAGIKIICTLTHRLGHFKTNSIILPPDKSGSKNAIQEIKSTVTYGRATTFEGICGLASSDANLDDDGNGAGGKEEKPKPTMDAADKKERLEFFPKCSTLKELHDHWHASYGEAKKVGDKAAMDEFNAAKDERKKNLLKDVPK